MFHILAQKFKNLHFGGKIQKLHFGAKIQINQLMTFLARKFELCKALILLLFHLQAKQFWRQNSN